VSVPDFLASIQPDPAYTKLRVLDTHRLVTTEPPPLDWLAEGIWCAGKLTMFGGREKRGKSLMQLALGVCMASGGGDLAGIRIKPGKVLLIDAENGEQEIWRRLRAIGLSAEHAGNLIAVEARGFELREDLGLVEMLIDRHRPQVVLLDSFRALWRGDERDEAQVAEALDPLRDLTHDSETPISLTHHEQKGGDEYRGSTAIGACVEWVVRLSREHGDADRTRRRLSNPLARFAPERDDRWLSIRSEGDDGPVTLVTAEAFVRERETPVQNEIESALHAWIEGRGTRGTPPIGSTTSTTPSWSTADLARAVGRSRDDKTLRRVVQRLADRGVLYRNGDERWSSAATLYEDDEDREA
jgi:AAA domain